MFNLFFAEQDQTQQGPAHPTPQPEAVGTSPAPSGAPTGAPPAPAVGAEQLEHATVGEEVNTVLTWLLPWAISILVHFGIILLAFFVVWSAGQAEEEEDVTPITQMLNDNPSELLVASEQLDVSSTTDVPREIQTQKVKQGDPLSAINSETADSLALIGVTGSAALPAGSKIGKDDSGVGMFGLGGNAMTVVYCVDASGSMVDSFEFVINELKDSLRKLSDRQRFNVVFFQAGSALEVPVPRRGMKQGTLANIKMVSDWISRKPPPQQSNVIPHGSTDPTSAIKLALSYKPDLVYILSDNITGRGRYQIDQKELIDLIEQTKKQQHSTTKINTIQFLYPDPLGTLKQIAEKNGGLYTFVDESVVGR